MYTLKCVIYDGYMWCLCVWVCRMCVMCDRGPDTRGTYTNTHNAVAAVEKRSTDAAAAAVAYVCCACGPEVRESQASNVLGYIIIYFGLCTRHMHVRTRLWDACCWWTYYTTAIASHTHTSQPITMLVILPAWHAYVLVRACVCVFVCRGPHSHVYIHIYICMYTTYIARRIHTCIQHARAHR